VGWALQQNKLPLSASVLMVSGRGGFEIIQKALAAGVPALASVSAPSGLAVHLARQFGMTLIVFLRGRRFVIYSESSRIGTYWISVFSARSAVKSFHRDSAENASNTFPAIAFVYPLLTYTMPLTT